MKLYSEVVDRLKADIESGKFKTGEKIPAEPELMKLYGVGRSTVREAIKTLAMSGLLKVQQGSGTFVNNHFEAMTIEQRLRRADFDDINAVRFLLEKEIVNLATERHTETQLAEIAQDLDKRKQAIQAENPEVCAEADIAFHLAIARAAGNPVLTDLYFHFTLILRNFFAARESHGISRFAMNHFLHEQLYQAIKARKQRQALQVLQRILDNNY
jgi:DNA-binding FadR family transcriptional regulator